MLLGYKYPPPLFFIFVNFYAYFRLGKRLSKGTAGLQLPAGTRNRKKQKITNKGRGVFVLKEQNTGKYQSLITSNVHRIISLSLQPLSESPNCT